MRSLYFSPALCHFTGDCEVLTVTPPFRELILRVIDLAALDSRVATHHRRLCTLTDEIDQLMRERPATTLMMFVPSERRALSFAQHVLDDPPGSESLDRLAGRFGMGRRTVERLFHEQTGISFGPVQMDLPSTSNREKGGESRVHPNKWTGVGQGRGRSGKVEAGALSDPGRTFNQRAAI